MVDGFATHYGLREGFYVELNQGLNKLYESNELAYLVVKVMLPTMTLLLLMAVLRKEENKVKLSGFTYKLVLFATIVYLLLVIYHIVLYGVYFLL